MSTKKPVEVDVKKAVGFKYPSDKVLYNRRDLLLYAAGLNLTELRFTYELEKNFSAFPTYPIVLPLKGDTLDVSSYAERAGFGNIPGLPKIDLNRLVHGEQYYELLAPLPEAGRFDLESTLTGVYDAGKGMILDKETVMKDASGKALAKMVSSAFVIGAGGFNGPRKPKPENIVDVPSRQPDSVEEIKTTPNQALIYRLSGDYNPLHADPRIGKKLGMKGAILHGLCFYGISAAAVLQSFANNEPSAFKSIYGRFASPVYPGETLQVNMWKVAEKDGKVYIAFVTKVKERDVVVISNGTVVLHSGAQSKL
ncbi:HotDog domain-containing protein [Fimicolochytrium jonesii]|uniref:HotDog domain-containing protein n=1 Tax=Fimicolochytrium jonesii TaxID=1396493 RepID=UPI0022FF073B|nr:HotDog domain-containing protein [Fimicolochytrium jonesii]KAI8827226.1 HotDog domain-containing protein [Fimicolochytrium jonesii]